MAVRGFPLSIRKLRRKADFLQSSIYKACTTYYTGFVFYCNENPSAMKLAGYITMTLWFAIES